MLGNRYALPCQATAGQGTYDGCEIAFFRELMKLLTSDFSSAPLYFSKSFTIALPTTTPSANEATLAA